MRRKVLRLQWTSLACIVIFVAGIQLLCIGIMGQYIAKMYMETKKRPIYIIAESNIVTSNNKVK